MFIELSIDKAHEFMYDKNYSILRRETLNKPKLQINHSNGFSFGSIGGKIAEAFNSLNKSCTPLNCYSSNL